MSSSVKLTELLIKLRNIKMRNASTRNFNVMLPIKEIDGICQLQCKIGYYFHPYFEYEMISFEVKTEFNNPTMLFNYEKRAATREDRLTEEELGEFAVKLLNEVLPNLKLQRNGKMDFEKDGEDAVISEIIDLFGIDNCDCAVCYEKTYVKTDCDHSLCYRCWSKLKKADCPLCREGIWHAREMDN
jgi:hypothetical protein